MIVVTGSNGFIGSNLIFQLNQRGVKDILAVDDLSKKDQIANLTHCEIEDLVDINDFYPNLDNNLLKEKKVKTIFHQGACSDTMEWDALFILKNNYLLAKKLLICAEKAKIPFIYASSASVYGDGKIFIEEKENEKPINLYAYSKYLFDQYVRSRIEKSSSQIVGLRYFNVYGPNEFHKSKMASVVHHLHQQLKKDQSVKLFEASGGYAAGEQRRDFVHVDDVVKVNLWFRENNNISGIFNVGTGESQTFKEVAEAVIEWNKKGSIQFIPFPKELIGSYQSFTEANLDKLRKAGYKDKFLNVQEGIKLYLDTLENWPSNEYKT